MKKPLSRSTEIMLGMSVIVLTIILVLGIPPFCSWFKEATKAPPTIEERRDEIEKMLTRRFTESLGKDLSVEIRNEGETSYCVGVLSETLENNLDSLVDCYNPHPWTEPSEQIGIDELRLALTDNIEETYQKWRDYSSNQSDKQEGYKDNVIEFILWCNTEADLVYKGDITYPDGTAIKAGDDIPTYYEITNYEHAIRRDDLGYDYCYRWEYEAMRSDTSQ